MSVEFLRVKADQDQWRHQFIELYRKTFAGEPYRENFSEEQVSSVWYHHLDHCIVLAVSQQTLVGLGCCSPLESAAPDIRDHLWLAAADAKLNLGPTAFMTELAVQSTHRGQKIGTGLVLARLAWANEAGFVHYAMRTDRDSSMSAGLYKRMGAEPLDMEQDLGHDVDGSSRYRRYYWGSVARALNAS